MNSTWRMVDTFWAQYGVSSSSGNKIFTLLLWWYGARPEFGPISAPADSESTQKRFSFALEQQFTFSDHGYTFCGSWPALMFGCDYDAQMISDEHEEEGE